jgi:5-methyltetrahydrofolate--homocysteine methyltransferase
LSFPEKIVVDVRELLDKGFDPDDILNQGMLPTMEVIGGRFTTGEVFIPEVLLSARICRTDWCGCLCHGCR